MNKSFLAVQRIGPYTQGEKPEPLVLSIKDASGAAIDLTGFSAKFQIEAVDGAVAGLGAGTASLPSPATGITQYAWAAADLATAGLYRGQMWVGNGSRRYASELFEWFVRDATDAPAV